MTNRITPYDPLYPAAEMYVTAAVRARIHVIIRSARRPTKLCCHKETNTVVASDGFDGAESICSDASRLTSIETPPSSANRIDGACTRITRLPTLLLTITGI